MLHSLYLEWLGVPAKPDADVCNIYQQLALNYATPSATRGWGPWRRPQAAAARAVDYRSHGQPVWRRGPRCPRVAPPPPPPAGAPPLPTGVLAKLKELVLLNTQVTDAGCAALAAALDGGALPALERLFLDRIPASGASKVAVYAALKRTASRAAMPS